MKKDYKFCFNCDTILKQINVSIFKFKEFTVTFYVLYPVAIKLRTGF